jgi:hypothetical protein
MFRLKTPSGLAYPSLGVVFWAILGELDTCGRVTRRGRLIWTFVAG